MWEARAHARVPVCPSACGRRERACAQRRSRACVDTRVCANAHCASRVCACVYVLACTGLRLHVRVHACARLVSVHPPGAGCAGEVPAPPPSPATALPPPGEARLHPRHKACSVHGACVRPPAGLSLPSVQYFRRPIWVARGLRPVQSQHPGSGLGYLCGPFGSS